MLQLLLRLHAFRNHLQIHSGKVHTDIYIPLAIPLAFFQESINALVNIRIQLGNITALFQDRNKFRRGNIAELTAEPSGQRLCQNHVSCPGIINRLIKDLDLAILDGTVQMKKSNTPLLVILPHLLIKNSVRLDKLVGNTGLGKLGPVTESVSIIFAFIVIFFT